MLTWRPPYRPVPPHPRLPQVYTVNTNSNNNTWLRRKLLEAVGASRRFYAAANKTGRPKPRGSKAPAAARVRAPKQGGAAAAAAPVTPRVGPPHLTPGMQLPAGSPRALLRRAGAAGGQQQGDTHFSHHCRAVLQAAQAEAAAAQQQQASSASAAAEQGRASVPPYCSAAPRYTAEADAACSEMSGSEAPPCTFAPYAGAEAATAVAVAAYEPGSPFARSPLAHPQAHMYSFGCAGRLLLPAACLSCSFFGLLYCCCGPFSAEARVSSTAS